jgi:nitrate reductase gamma subunit
VGNVAWWWVVDSITNDKIAIYLNGMIDSGIMFGFFFYSLFFLLTPFIFFKLKYSHSSKAQMAAVIGLTIVSIAIVAGVWILLFAIAIRGLMNTF